MDAFGVSVEFDFSHLYDYGIFLLATHVKAGR